MNKRQEKKLKYFIDYMENFFTLTPEEKKAIIEEEDDERFQAYLKRVSVLNEEEQKEEMEYLKCGK